MKRISFYFQESGPLEERGVVMAVLDKAFDVLVLNLGVVKRVYVDVSFVYRNGFLYDLMI